MIFNFIQMKIISFKIILFSVLKKVPTLAERLCSQTDIREVLDSNPGRACRHSRFKFSVVFSGILVDTGYDLFERSLRRAFQL